MTTDLATTDSATIIERVIIAGDLSKLQPQERVSYYNAVCSSLGLNPLTKPFEYITLNNKLTLYATRNCTDQLRAAKRVSVQIAAREKLEDIYVVTARATLPDGRADESIGAVNIAGLRGDNLANALMKAETKAKRRATLSICGLSFADETEVPTIPGAQPVVVDSATGEIVSGHTNGNGKKPPTAAGARARFFQKWGPELRLAGDALSWDGVCGALDWAGNTPEPATVAQWAEANQWVADALAGGVAETAEEPAL
jgi:hypothetical protein